MKDQTGDKSEVPASAVRKWETGGLGGDAASEDFFVLRLPKLILLKPPHKQKVLLLGESNALDT